jgi:hypothetical protein
VSKYSNLIEQSINMSVLFGLFEAARRLGQCESRQCVLKKDSKKEIMDENIVASLAMAGNPVAKEQLILISEFKPSGLLEHQEKQVLAVIQIYNEHKLGTSISKEKFLRALLKLEKEFNTGIELDIIEKSKYDEFVLSIDKLFDFLDERNNVHALVKSAVFHYGVIRSGYYFESSALLARLYHRLILGNSYPVYFYAPFETLFRMDYATYVECSKELPFSMGLEKFIGLSIRVASGSLARFMDSQDNSKKGTDERLEFAKMHFGSAALTRKKYMKLFANIAPATASRDLKAGYEAGLLKREGKRASCKYLFLTG